MKQKIDKSWLDLTKRCALVLVLLALGACQDAEQDARQDATLAQNTTSQAQGVAQALVGCYTVNQGEPAVIKISINDDGNNNDGNDADAQPKGDQTAFVMQMKEPNKLKIWDDPEALEVLDAKEAWRYFGQGDKSAKLLDVTQKDIQGVLARPDRMMVIARLDPTVTNLNPLLDSQYLVHIYHASNTIYQVPCDEVPVDIVGDSAKRAHGGAL